MAQLLLDDSYYLSWIRLFWILILKFKFLYFTHCCALFINTTLVEIKSAVSSVGNNLPTSKNKQYDIIFVCVPYIIVLIL